MKKLNLKLAGISEVLTKEQMKKISGGYGDDATACTKDSDCGAGQRCATLGFGYICITIENGDACTTNSDCGNGQKCFNTVKPYYCGPTTD